MNPMEYYSQYGNYILPVIIIMAAVLILGQIMKFFFMRSGKKRLLKFQNNTFPIEFNYADVLENGKSDTLYKHATLNADHLTLDNRKIPYSDIDNIEAIQMWSEIYLNNGELIRFQNISYTSDIIKAKVDELTSKIATQNKDSITCPKCSCHVEMSPKDRTEYTFCRYCKSLFNRNNEIKVDGHKYALCPATGLFDRLQFYTEFYFMFLIVVQIRKHVYRILGDYYAESRLFPKMLLKNLIFILGIVPSFLVLRQAKAGREKSLKTLPKLNKEAYSGRVENIPGVLEPLLQAYPNHPGLLFNKMYGFAVAGKKAEARMIGDQILGFCHNYRPVLDLQEKLDSSDKQAA